MSEYESVHYSYCSQFLIFSKNPFYIPSPSCLADLDRVGAHMHPSTWCTPISLVQRSGNKTVDVGKALWHALSMMTMAVVDPSWPIIFYNFASKLHPLRVETSLCRALLSNIEQTCTNPQGFAIYIISSTRFLKLRMPQVNLEYIYK